MVRTLLLAALIIVSGGRGVPPPSGGGGGDAPAYIQSLTTFEVMSLASVSGGSLTINAALSAAAATYGDWTTNDPSLNQIGIIIPWSGGTGDPEGRRLFVHGGGHNDSAINGILTFTLGDGETPLGWTIETGSLSTIANTPTAMAAHDVYNDGKPGSVHTYDGVWYDATTDDFCRSGGAYYRDGGYLPDTWCFDFSTDAWVQRLDNPSGGVEVPMLAHDPATRKVFYTRGGSSNGWFYRPTDNTWSGNKAITQVPDSATGYLNFVNRDGHAEFLIIGANVNRRVTVDWTAETVSSSTFTPTGGAACDLLGDSGLAALYDPTRDSYWIFGGSGGPPAFTHILELDAATFACTETALTGDLFDFDYNGGSDANYTGTYDRAVLIDDWRVILTATGTQETAYVVKLP